MNNLLSLAVNENSLSSTSIVSVRGDGVSLGASIRVLGVESVSLDVVRVRSIKDNILSLRETLRDSVSRGDVVSVPLESNGGLSSQVIVTGKSGDNRVSDDGAALRSNRSAVSSGDGSLDNSVELVKSSGSERDLASVVSEVKVGKLRKLDNTGRVTSGEADSLPGSESIDNFDGVSTSGSSSPGSTEGSAVVNGPEVSDLLDRLGTRSDSLVSVDRRVSGEIVRVLDSNSNNDVEGISVYKEEGALSSEGAHGGSARELVSNISAVNNFLVASIDSLVLSFDNVSFNLVLGNTLG